MEINEAIKHCKEKAMGCSACAKEHGQLAEWLEELQNYRDTGLTPSMVRSLIKREKESHKRVAERPQQMERILEKLAARKTQSFCDYEKEDATNKGLIYLTCAMIYDEAIEIIKDELN